MQGMSAETGKPLNELAHLIQSILDILTTPIGTRIMVRDYGSNLWEIIDAPITDETIIDIYAEVARALDQWEPRITVLSVNVLAARQGFLEFDLQFIDRDTGEAQKLEGVVIS